MSAPAPKPLDTAIVGLSACFPGAKDAQAYWRNILAKVDSVADADPEWVGPYFEKDTTADDRIYTTKGGFLRDLAQVDPQSFGVMPNVAAGSDPDHLLALQFARDALADSGYLDKPFNRERAGVILGRGTYGNKALGSSMARSLFLDQAMDFVRALRPDFAESEVKALQESLKTQLMPFQAEHIGVLTPNVIAGLIANRLNLMGPSCIVDAACASTLIAVEQAVRELESGRCDLMITGGIHAHTPPQIFIQFCRINALSRDKIRPFQKGSEGTLLGEGVGLMVLKRRADAERDGDRIYAVIRGIGTASDGKAKGLLAPRLEGEVLAVRRAYETSGIDPDTIDLIEAHGTGTSIGDRTEIESLNTVFGGRGPGPQIGITAVKSMIGHCMPASGAAALIKTALALHHKVLPPMLCDEPDPTLGLDKTPFYLNTETRPWVHGKAHPRRAGVNAFGFGGINSHFILEEYVPPAPQPMAALHGPANSELLMLAAESAIALASKARHALAHLTGAAPATLDEIALAASNEAQGEHRLAIVASTAADLIKKLESAIEKLVDVDLAAFKTRNGIHYGAGATPGKLCLLFPGEGSQYPNMLGDLATQFEVVRDWFDFIEHNALARGSPSRAQVLFPPPTGLDAGQRRELADRLFEMDIAAESVFAANMGLHALFTQLGFVPDALLGHSTGENSALTAAAVNKVQSRSEIARIVTDLNTIYRKLESAGQITEGTLLTVGGLNAELRAELLKKLKVPGSGVQLAMDNCPNQVVLFGSSEATSALKEELSTAGALCALLPFGRAYHTPLFKPLADAFRSYFAALDVGAARTTLYSACSVGPFPADAAGIRELCCAQWENPVRFTETIERLYADGVRVFLEIGPSGNLTSFVGDTLKGRDDVLALASNNRRKSGMAQLHATLAQLFVAGVPFTPSALFAQRAIAPLALMTPPRAAAKPRLQLKLITPTLTLPEAFRKPLPKLIERVVETAPAPVLAPPSTIPTAPISSDPRMAALNAHFSLMQDFLDSQARVLGLATSADSAPVQAVASKPLAAFPMLGTVVEETATRLVTERTFDIREDLFLRDHAIGGVPTPRDPSLLPLPVIPFTFSMELVAEAGARLLNRQSWVVTAIEDARGSRWLSLDSGQIPLRIVAEQQSASSKEARIACRVFLRGEGSTPGGMLVFEGVVVLAAFYPAAPAPMPCSASDDEPPRLHKAGQVYQHGMFHGPRLQGCTAVNKWGHGGMEAEITVIATHDYFASTQPHFQFDAAVLDAAGQIAGFWLRERYAEVRNCFPFRVRVLRLFAPPPAAGTKLSCRGAIVMQGETQLEARWDLFGADGQLVMQSEGWEDRVFAVPDRFHAFRMNPDAAPLSVPALADRLPAELCVRRLEPLPEGLLDEGGTIWKRVLAHMILSRAEREAFYKLPAQGERREEWLMGRLAAKDAVRDYLHRRGAAALAAADVEILEGPHGKPLVRIAALPDLVPPALSLSHSQRWAVAVASDASVALGIDYQRPDRVRGEHLISGGFSPAEQMLIAAQEPERSQQAIALWCAKEAAAKAAGTGLEGRPLDWQIVAAHLDLKSGAPAVARVRRGASDYDCALHVESDGAVIALCVTAAPTTSPSLTH
ncbi:MAG: beta-ketoacyl synthase N-terminal-like domain-containing protein [Pseudomonadota bacterium]